MRSIRRSGYVTLRCLLLVAVGAVVHSAVAQPQQQSHRILELPQGGMSDLAQQLQMLRQLQTLIGGQKDQPPEFSGLDPGQLDQLDQLRQMMKQFGGEPPENLLPFLNSIPPSAIQHALSDPMARQQIQQLFEQYAKDHQLPRGRRGSRMPLLPPSEENGTTKRPSPNRSTGDPSSSTEHEQEPPEPGRSVDPSNAALKKALEGVMKRFSDSQQTENQSSADQSSADQSSRTPTNQRPARNGDTQNSWSDMLDRMIEQDRKFREGNSTEASKDQRSTNAPSGNGQTGSMNDGSGKNAPSKTVAEYLEELKNQPPPPVRKKPQTRRPAEKPNDVSRQPPSAPDESAVAHEQLQQNARSSLQRRGFTETLRKLARDARQQVRSSGGDPGDAANGSQTAARSAGSSGFERALIRALDGVREDIVEIAKDAKFKPSRSGNGSPTTGRTSNSQSGSDSGMRSFGRSAGNFLNELAAPASATNSSSSATVSINDAVTENIFGLLTLLVLLGIVAVFAWKSGLLATPFGEPAYAPPMRAADIRTKEDVVNAFHRMALQPSRQVQRWWTHRKAADRMFHDHPEHNQAMEVLTELYEQARYLPEETAFSQEQIQSARQALKQCESC
ncbi:MAG: DUF4129 domain-containing protein [Fuerstiella sp.]